MQTNRERLPAIFEQVVQARNSPIALYAKVLDQSGTPLPGVKVKLTVRHWYVESPGNAQAQALPFEVDTAADGQFGLHGTTGDGIDVLNVQKQGYDLSPNASLHYGPSSGSLRDPVIFKMWKVGAKEPLVTGDKFFRIVPDGRTYTIDLLKGTKAESGNTEGDFRISVKRPEGMDRKDRYDWSFKITPFGGGIIESQDEFMYQAPETNYASEYVFQLAAADPQWRYRVKKNFYLKTRGGQNYARLSVEVFAYYDGAAVFDIHYAVNPAASRNLQP